MKHPSLTAILGLCLGLLALPATAATVSVSSGVGDTLVDAAGLNLDASFTFQIGTFATGFTPDALNTAMWEANWKPFAEATAPAVNGWNPTAHFFNADAEFLPNFTSNAGLSADTFAQGNLLYLWVYDSKVLSPTVEWALVTNNSSDGNASDNWVLPNPNDLGGGTGEFALSSATVPIFGGANGDYGGGTITTPLGAFQLQTALVPVPEPGGLMLLGAAGAVWGLRRKRTGR